MWGFDALLLLRATSDDSQDAPWTPLGGRESAALAFGSGAIWGSTRYGGGKAGMEFRISVLGTRIRLEPFNSALKCKFCKHRIIIHLTKVIYGTVNNKF